MNTAVTKQELCLLLNTANIGTDLGIKNGHFFEKNFFSRLSSRFASSLFGSGQASAELKNRINEICTQLLIRDKQGNANITQAKSKMLKMVYSNDKHEQKEIVAIFCNQISSIYNKKDKKDAAILGINQFKRTCLKESLKENQDYQNAKKIRESLLSRDINSPLSLEGKIQLLETKTNAKIAKMKILHSTGEMGRSEKGVTGTTLIFDYREDGTERLMGVFKPDGAYAPFSVKLGNIFRRFFGQHSLLKKPLDLPAAENVAYEASKFFNLISVPPSSLIEVGEVRGVFQLAAQTFVKTLDNEQRKSNEINLSDAASLLEPSSPTNCLNSPRIKANQAVLEAFQEFAIHDFLIGNLDCHDENWLVELTNNRSFFVGIDKANSFLVSNPGTWGIGSENQYMWKKTPLARVPFTEKMRAKMREMTPQKVDQFLKLVKKSHPEFLEPSMEYLLRERANAIREIAEINGATPADLAKRPRYFVSEMISSLKSLVPAWIK